MNTTTAPLSGSILYQTQQNTVQLLETAAKEWAERGEQFNQDSASLLAQMVRICLRSPDMMRDLWEWVKAEQSAGRLREAQRVGDDVREQLGHWLQLLALIRPAAAACKSEGYALGGADEVAAAADELQAILKEVNETWPPQAPITTPPLSYAELRSLADRFPPPPEWYQEPDDLF